jgi:DNA-binding response OmpR family regulator
LDQLKAGGFDLLLLGTTLPGATPEDACAPLRAVPQGEGVPVVALSSEGNRPTGAHDWLAKPVNMFELTLKSQAWALKRQLQTL